MIAQPSHGTPEQQEVRNSISQRLTTKSGLTIKPTPHLERCGATGGKKKTAPSKTNLVTTRHFYFWTHKPRRSFVRFSMRLYMCMCMCVCMRLRGTTKHVFSFVKTYMHMTFSRRVRATCKNISYFCYRQIQQRSKRPKKEPPHSIRQAGRTEYYVRRPR